MKKKSAFIAIFILSSLVVMSAFNANTMQAQGPIANLVLKTNGGGVRPDIALYIAQYLADIGVEIEVKVEEWSVFVGTLYLTHNYDIGIVRLGGGGAYPGSKDVWDTTGSLNVFGLGPDIPYQNESEVYQTIQETMVDPDARQAYLYEWQQLVMDKIIPILPLTSSRVYNALWANTLGYDERWGLRDSMPYMTYDGYHSGQVSLDEFSFADANWVDLNPLFSIDGSSGTVQAYLLEQMMVQNPDYAPTKNGLIYDWEEIDETHFQFYLRDDIYWNPSYNSTARDANSGPLESEDLMLGLKDGLASTGTSHQVTATDAVFTFLAWSNNITTARLNYHTWISDIYEDPIDDLSFHIHIDGDTSTSEIEPYADMWSKLPWEILPEFFLNSTNPYVWETVSGIETTGLYPDMDETPQWRAFSNSAFGCGQFSFDYSIENAVTVLKRSPYWHGIGALTGDTGLVPFVEYINIRVIPDSSAELAEFKAGKLDIGGVSSFPTERKIMQSDPQYIVKSYIDSSMLFMFYNLRRPFIGGTANLEYLDAAGKEEYTKGIAVRKALNYAIDRDEINTVIYEGEAWIAHSTIYPSQAFFYYNDIIKYNYDLDASEEWLLAAGYEVDIVKTPFPVLAIVAAIGAAAFLAYYRKRK